MTRIDVVKTKIDLLKTGMVDRKNRTWVTIKRSRDYLIKTLSHPALGGVTAIIGLIIACLGLYIIYADYPNYPLINQRITPISSKTYIDNGWDLVHDTEYLVELPKIRTPNETFIPMLTDVRGGYASMEIKGYGHNFSLYVDPSDLKTIRVKNPDRINPILLHAVYIEKSFENGWIPVAMIPIFPNSNDSFYMLIKNSDNEIKHGNEKYNLVKYANEVFKTTMYDSWKNQRIIIYENNMPIQNTYIGSDGNASIDIMSMKPGEHKTYFVKKN